MLVISFNLIKLLYGIKVDVGGGRNKYTEYKHHGCHYNVQMCTSVRAHLKF